MLSDDILKKLNILTAAAKYDVACTSSGVVRTGPAGNSGMGNTAACGICHCFAGDGRCISLLKILYSNHCIHDCRYCINRRSNDVPRTSFTPEEIAELTISFYKRNYIEGLFLSSGVTRSPNDTMEQMYRALLLLRKTYNFNGYIHVKAIPGADNEIIDRIGWLADRMSVNLELPTADSLKELAPGKSRKSILTPMRNIQLMRENDMIYHGDLLVDNSGTLFGSGMLSDNTETYHAAPATQKEIITASDLPARRKYYKPTIMRSGNHRYVPAGQSTQLIIGASPDTDYEIVKVSESLYNRFDLKRVFYSAFMNVNNDSDLPDTTSGPPLLREHRLYQADFLLRFYNFTADEIITPDNPMLNTLIDPKCNYALNHLDMFPVEVTTASYKTLLRVPGIGVTSARRIMHARKHSSGCHLTFGDLKKLGIVMKRAQYFITCGGKSFIPIRLSQSFILANLLGLNERLPQRLSTEETYEQLSLFDVSPELIVNQYNQCNISNSNRGNYNAGKTYTAAAVSV